MNRRTYPCFIIALAVIFLVACDAAPAGPAEATVPPATPLPAATSTVVAPAQPSPTPRFDYEGWVEYTNDQYGFSLLYPPGWAIEPDLRADSTSYQHLLWLRPPAEQRRMVLSIGFKRAGEAYGIQRTGVGAGEFETRGTIPFLGEEVTRWVLVAEGKDMSVLYNQAAETRGGDMVFTLALDYVGSPTDPSALPEDVQQQADMIVASVRMGG